MTLAMPDSINVVNLPAGYPAYLGYVDGHWPTYAELKAKFPAAYHVGLTVTGGTLNADGIDVEPGNPDAAAGAHWAHDKLAHSPGSRPILYASMEGTAGYGMPDVLAHLAALGIPRNQVRLHAAHYTGHAHICSPAICRFGNGQPITYTADATQWTSEFPGHGGALIDMSELASNFFTGGAAPMPDELKPITVLPPGNWKTAVLTGTADDGTYTAAWDGKKWTKLAWPVQPA
jgi:hypothetical protein